MHSEFELVKELYTEFHDEKQHKYFLNHMTPHELNLKFKQNEKL